MANAKQHAHELIDRLPEPQLSAVIGLLEAILEPVSYANANARDDDEELTPEAIAVLDRARASLDRGRGIPHEEILREFGPKK